MCHTDMHHSFIVTGATGVVGSELVANLLRAGHTVACIVRTKKGKSGRDRLESIIKASRGENFPLGKLVVVEGDITLPQCGLSLENSCLLRRLGAESIVHLAANVKMDESRREEIAEANIIGTQNVLELAEMIRCKQFHYVSTAYVANGQENVYEQTKTEAEKLVMDWSQIIDPTDEKTMTDYVPELRKYMISRISIVVGRGKDAYISNVSNGFYGYFLPFVQIAKAVRAVRKLPAENTVSLSAEISVAEGAHLNIIPLDWVANMLWMITERVHENKTLNVVHPNPPLTRQMISDTLSALKISGVKFGEKNLVEGVSRFCELIFERVMDVFKPYVGKSIAFDDTGLRQFLGRDYFPPTEYSAESFAKLISFAVKQNFGREK